MNPSAFPTGAFQKAEWIPLTVRRQCVSRVIAIERDAGAVHKAAHSAQCQQRTVCRTVSLVEWCGGMLVFIPGQRLHALLERFCLLGDIFAHGGAGRIDPHAEGFGIFQMDFRQKAGITCVVCIQIILGGIGGFFFPVVEAPLLPSAAIQRQLRAQQVLQCLV